MREKIRVVMRYAGLRMFYRHPILTLFHFINGFRKEPVHIAQTSRPNPQGGFLLLPPSRLVCMILMIQPTQRIADYDLFATCVHSVASRLAFTLW